MTAGTTGVERFAWLVNSFVNDVPAVQHAAVVSSDGLLLTTSTELSPERAEQLSAVASGMLSLAHGVSELFAQGRFERTIVRMQRGYLFLTTVAEGCCLAVLAGERCDTKVVAYQMALFVEKAGHVLTPALRGQLREAVAR
ncbi:roadblock/LC7 domain-containing protein [Lipingzhangella sp. LS1_29]|uniref:Roadblock/LC7 domain-containing protein n=1 Tax=Lipingzhangella rawalii TaxID=2055835 RepID=A0ABU2H9V6_9ACTN|nr:roadblock/LC7 domain-containing protein [Lipingzhangella rawalii]MDS1272097.1 roadblock/LC7 domain-containing protein [Lipingzhangella rawalii]